MTRYEELEKAVKMRKEIPDLSLLFRREYRVTVEFVAVLHEDEDMAHEEAWDRVDRALRRAELTSRGFDIYDVTVQPE